MSEFPTPEISELQDPALPKFWDVFLAHQRLKAGIEFELGLFVQKMVVNGTESYTLYDDGGHPIDRGDLDRVNANFSLDTSGVAGFFVREPWMLVHTHPTTLDEDESQVTNIVDLPSDDDLSDADLHKMIVWGAEKFGFFATVIERPEIPEDIEAYRQAVEKYKIAVESNDQAEMRRILTEDFGGKFYRLVESDDTREAMSPKQAGMDKGKIELSSGVELPETDFIYQQNDYRDRRYTLSPMTDEEEKQTAQDYYHNMDLHRATEHNRIEQRRRVVAANCANMPKSELSNRLNSLRIKSEQLGQQLEIETDSSQRTNLLFALKNTETDTAVIEGLVSSTGV